MRANPAVIAREATGISECLERLTSERRETRPLATYRMQFNAGFRFEDARRLTGYLHALGVSHLYSSPILKAQPGSAHGYDITDHNQVNPEIGSYEDLQALSSELRNYGMGEILDFVPNHMGIGVGANPWWTDVLANGRASEFADFFDLDWDPLKPELRDKLLLPVLGDQYGAELEAGHIRLAIDDSAFHVEYYDKQFPLDPRTIPMIYEAIAMEIDDGEENERLHSLLTQLSSLPSHNVTEPGLVQQRQQTGSRLLEELAKLLRESARARNLAENAVERCNGTPGDTRSFDCLHRLLEEQAYRLANWKVSGEEINYRRFFDINDLIGLRMEDPRVFAATHQLIRKLLAEGLVQGLRIDHLDGLLNPRQYLIRLQMLYAASRCFGEEPRPPLAENGIELEMQDVFGRSPELQERPPLYVVVEKVLLPGEELRTEWPVDGSSGYEFTALVNGVFVDGRNEKQFTDLYHRVIGGTVDLDSLVYESKKVIMHSSLSSEINVLAHLLDEISHHDRYARDFTRKALRDVIRETIACFPVYRTYIDERGEGGERDAAYIKQAIARSKRRNADKASASFDFLRDILLLKRRPSEDQPTYRKKIYFTLKFQQLTGPVMAKGLEDTAFYTYNRFIAANEIGGSPKRFSVAPEDFHRSNQTRSERWPFSMLATSTHDTKRSEDVRARLDVLSEMPRAWANRIHRWQRVNAAHKPTLADGRRPPDSNEEYLFYQTLVGTWPFAFPTSQSRQQYTQRMQQYMTKAVHEAKVNLSWISPDPDYVQAIEQFVAAILGEPQRGKPNRFLDRFTDFLPSIMFFGAINSVAQRLLLITSPGNPDIYQGTELWDFSLVDPDNRRPVDFARREKFLAELDRQAEGGNLPELCADLLENYQDGRLKLWTTMQSLRARREHRPLFHSGAYTPLEAAGNKSQHVVSFARENEGRVAVIVLPRLSYTLMGGAIRAPLGEVWEQTEVPVPPSAGALLENVLTGEKISVGEKGTILCREVFAHFPIALLLSV